MNSMSPPSRARYTCFVLLLCSPRLGMCFAPIRALPVPSFLKSACSRHQHKKYFLASGGSALHMTSIASSPEDIGDNLTKEELGLRLKGLRDYYREANKKSQEAVCLEFFRTRFRELRLNRCFVAESTIRNAGKGLFASRNIEEGELITLYPGDVMLAWETTVGDFAGEIGVMYGNHVKEEDRTVGRLTSDSAREYELKIGGRHSVVADPLLVDDAAYLGHMANDAAMLTSRDKESIDTYVNITETEQNAANFVMEGSHFVTVATKNIPKGKEIFTSYGYGYWFSRAHQKGPLGLSETEAGTGTNVERKTSTGINNEIQSITKKDTKISKSTKRTGTKKGFGKN